jgi:hypothetical protein
MIISRGVFSTSSEDSGISRAGMEAAAEAEDIIESARIPTIFASDDM